MSSSNTSITSPPLSSNASITPSVVLTASALSESITIKDINPGDTVVIGILGQGVEVPNVTYVGSGVLEVVIIMCQILGYDDTTMISSVTLPSSCHVFFQQLSRDKKLIGERFPFDHIESRDSMQEVE